MTVITSDNVTVVEEFYVIRARSGFWKEAEEIDSSKIIGCTGYPLEAMRFETPDAALVCIEDNRSWYNGRADVMKVTSEVKMEEVK